MDQRLGALDPELQVTTQRVELIVVHRGGKNSWLFDSGALLLLSDAGWCG